MENEIDPKRTINLTWDDPWKKYEERWKKNDTWAVKKKGQKRAIRVLESEHEAEKYINWHDETDTAYIKKTDLEIEFRCGEHTRCGNYCSVADFCNQYKGEKDGR